MGTTQLLRAGSLAVWARAWVSWACSPWRKGDLPGIRWETSSSPRCIEMLSERWGQILHDDSRLKLKWEVKAECIKKLLPHEHSWYWNKLFTRLCCLRPGRISSPSWKMPSAMWSDLIADLLRARGWTGNLPRCLATWILQWSYDLLSNYKHLRTN